MQPQRRSLRTKDRLQATTMLEDALKDDRALRPVAEDITLHAAADS